MPDLTPKISALVAREEIAKIIDPEAFGLPPKRADTEWLTERDEAREKASDILKWIAANV